MRILTSTNVHIHTPTHTHKQTHTQNYNHAYDNLLSSDGEPILDLLRQGMVEN